MKKFLHMANRCGACGHLFVEHPGGGKCQHIEAGSTCHCQGLRVPLPG